MGAGASAEANGVLATAYCGALAKALSPNDLKAAVAALPEAYVTSAQCFGIIVVSFRSVFVLSFLVPYPLFMQDASASSFLMFF